MRLIRQKTVLGMMTLLGFGALGYLGATAVASPSQAKAAASVCGDEACSGDECVNSPGHFCFVLESGSCDWTTHCEQS